MSTFTTRIKQKIVVITKIKLLIQLSDTEPSAVERKLTVQGITKQPTNNANKLESSINNQLGKTYQLDFNWRCWPEVQKLKFFRSVKIWTII